jgi:hypothetical protein
MSNFRSDLDLQTKTRSKTGALGQDHVTSAVEVASMSPPRLEALVSEVASTLDVAAAINIAIFIVLWFRCMRRVRVANERGLKRCQAAIHEPGKGQLVVYEKGNKDKAMETALRVSLHGCSRYLTILNIARQSKRSQ